MNSLLLALILGSTPQQTQLGGADLFAVQQQTQQGQEPPPAKPTKHDPDEEKHQKDLEKDRQLGKEYSIEVEKELKLSTNADATARLQAIGAEMAEIANSEAVAVLWGDRRLNKFDYTFKLVQGEDVNAFSLPGGYIYFYEGLLKFAESDDELAAVVAHEIAHASFRHVETLRKEQSKFDILRIPLIIAAALSRSPEAMHSVMAVDLATQGLVSGWSTQAETASDYGGLQYMKKSRYNPVGMLTFMERLAYKEVLSPQLDWGIYRTHPPSSDRAKFLIKSLNEAGIPLKRSQTTTSLSARSLLKPDGSFDLWFGDTLLYTFKGESAKARAAQAVIRTNAFLDTVPQMFQLTTNGNEVLGNGRTMIAVEVGDLDEGKSVADARDKVVVGLKRIIGELSFRLFRQ